MKKTTIKFILVILLFNLEYNKTAGQGNITIPQKEAIRLFTDRTLYVSGENIPFAAYLFIENNDDSNIASKDISKIIYVELIKSNGERISAGKFQCENSFGQGMLAIPKDILTGMYYIKAYTKFMRNSGPNSYSYNLLKIINPFKSDILKNETVLDNIKDSVQSNNVNKVQYLLTVLTDKNEYLTRESAIIQIKNNFNPKKTIIKELNISIIPEHTFVDQIINPLQSNDSPKKQYFIPETRGIILTGVLKDSKSDSTIANTTVNLSILGDCKDFIAVKTKPNGQFLFNMPELKGIRDVFICTELNDDITSTILIDNDFCDRKVQLPTPAFQLNEEEKKIALLIVQNFQIASSFNKNKKTDSSKSVNKAFYSEPQEKLILDQYIQLPTIEDYINELIPTLKIRKYKGHKYFRIYRTQSELEIYKPLVLLDLVAIANPEKILSLSPQNISYVETVNSPYIKGDIIYGGIISFFSKKGDFAGIDLPSSGIFLDFNFLDNFTDVSKDVNIKDNQPDPRITILWNPKIEFNTSNSYEESFITSDTPGKYIILLRGITKDGKVFSIKKPILIKSRI